MLALEGGDAIGQRVDRLDQLVDRGVRMITPIHLGDNVIGTCCLPWQSYVGAAAIRRSKRGLTEFGRTFIIRMNELGILIDLSHCDDETTADILSVSKAPTIASHSGARALQAFPRYLHDDQITRIAEGGGLIGLWPYYYRKKGVKSVVELVKHATHIASLVGAQHMCVGSDANGLPGSMAGYDGEPGLLPLRSALLEAGFSQADIQGIFGENFCRLFSAVTSLARSSRSFP
jgi:membrane dipeptidase